jgi:formiminoglutamase
MLIPVQKNLLFSKNDPEDIRIGELIQTQSEMDSDFVILGYPDDEGISLNGGRIGASSAPDKIREFLCKMTPPASLLNSKRISDQGNLETSGALVDRHKNAKIVVEKFYSQNRKIISFGGGHDYGYPDAAGFAKTFCSTKTKPLIINFDAHLDVRPPTNGYNSGTPFHRLLCEFNEKIDFVEIGIQPQCNSPHHRRWAIEHGAQIINFQEFQTENDLTSVFHQLCSRLPALTPAFISLDIDAIVSSEGGGCSQSWTTGIHFKNYLSFVKKISEHFEVKGLGIYEVSPPLDVDNRTSKMAALAAYHFIYGDQI